MIKIDRNLPVFLIFLGLSAIFWFLQTIQENTEVTLSYRLIIEDMPNDVVFTSDMPSEINVSYSSKGWNAFYYKFMRNDNPEIVVNFKEVNQKSGKVIIDANTLRRAVMRKKPQGMTFKTTSPNKIEAYYSNGQHKRVPVIFNGPQLDVTSVAPFSCPIPWTSMHLSIFMGASTTSRLKMLPTQILRTHFKRVLPYSSHVVLKPYLTQ